MENWDEQNFNSEWREALQGAEATPSEQVWKNIDTRLMFGENATMKKRVLFYQRLAAASVGILFLVSGYAYWTSNSTNNQSLAEEGQIKTSTEKNIAKENNSNASDAKVDQDDTNVSTANETAGKNESSDSYVIEESDLKNTTTSNEMIAVDPSNEVVKLKAVEKQDQTSFGTYAAADPMYLAFSPDKLSLALPKTAKPNDLSIAYRIADAQPAIHKKKSKGISDEQTWAALGFAAGAFSQNASNLAILSADKSTPTSFSNLHTSSNSNKTEKTKPGSSFSWSLSGGKRIAKRWLLQGGLNYLNQNTQNSTSSLEVASAYSLNNSAKVSTSFAPENTNSVTYTADSEIKSTFQFISLPVQAGYMLVDQKFGVQINGGISPDLFLRSVMSDKASGTETVNTTGSNSTFKTVSLSGLGGVELSYRFAEHYRISLVPGFRYSLTPVYKENSLASAKPFIADIGLRFRYVF